MITEADYKEITTRKLQHNNSYKAYMLFFVWRKHTGLCNDRKHTDVYIKKYFQSPKTMFSIANTMTKEGKYDVINC